MKPTSVLLLSDFAYPIVGGTERIVFGLAKFLVERGVKAHILTPNWDNSKELEDVDGVKIHRFKTPLMKNPFLKIYGYVKTTMKLQKENNFDIYHSFYFVPVFLSSLIMKWTVGKKTVLSLFEREPLEAHFNNPIKKGVILWALKKADYITTLSYELNDYLKTNYSFKKNITTIPGAVEDRFHPMRMKKEKRKTILFVGRMCKQKGIYVLIRAFSIIRKRLDCQLVLIGPPWEEKKIRKMIKNLGLSNHVKLIGFVSDDELVKWYNRCDVFVLPPLYKGGFGVAIVEAMACGKPAVGSDDIGVPDAIGDGGVVTKAGDEKSLAEGILKLLTDKKFYNKCKRNAIRRIEKHFRRDKILGSYLDIYHKVLNKRNVLK